MVNALTCAVMYVKTECMPSSVRYFCRVTPDKTPFPVLGRDYLKSILEAKLPTRAMCPYLITWAGFADATWTPELRAAFSTPIPELTDPFVNIVCGFGDDFARLYVKGKDNIAITCTEPRLPNTGEIIALKRYTSIVAPTLVDAVGLCNIGTHAQCVEPEKFGWWLVLRTGVSSLVVPNA